MQSLTKTSYGYLNKKIMKDIRQHPFPYLKNIFYKLPS